MTDHTYGAEARSVALTLSAAAGCWAVAISQMHGMDMGVRTTLGSFGFFIGVWAAMMAAMMLPGAAPAISDYARAHRRSGAAAGFATAYVVVWTLVGVAAYTIDRPHGTVAAGVVIVGAGIYELTPVKRRARQRCRARVSSGFHLGLYCVGSTLGLMLILLAVGVMSVVWMSVIAALVAVQKLLSPHLMVDTAFALAIVGFGIFILIDPSSVPGLVPAM